MLKVWINCVTCVMLEIKQSLYGVKDFQYIVKVSPSFHVEFLVLFKMIISNPPEQ